MQALLLSAHEGEVGRAVFSCFSMQFGWWACKFYVTYDTCHSEAQGYHLVIVTDAKSRLVCLEEP